MKLNSAIIFMASLASGVYASGNLRSSQKLEEEVQNRVKPDEAARLEKHRKMGSEENAFPYHELTLEEAEKCIEEMDALADEATLTDPEIGNYADEWYEDEPSVKELIQEERLGGAGYDPDPSETRAPVAKPTAPPGHTLLSFSLRTDSFPEYSLVWIIDRIKNNDVWDYTFDKANTLYGTSIWLPNNGCYEFGFYHTENGGLKGNGPLTVTYGAKTYTAKKHLKPGSNEIFRERFGTGCAK